MKCTYFENEIIFRKQNRSYPDQKNSAVCVRTRMVNVNTFSTTSIICLEIEITMKDFGRAVDTGVAR